MTRFIIIGTDERDIPGYDPSTDPRLNLSGPLTNVGLVSPPTESEPKGMPQGTVRLAPQGEGRKLQSDLCIVIPKGEPAWTFRESPADFLLWTVRNEAGKIVMLDQKPAPSAVAPLESGSQIFRAHKYGGYGFKFPSSLGVAGSPIYLTCTWSINPAIGQGELSLVLWLNGEDFGIAPATTWRALDF